MGTRDQDLPLASTSRSVDDGLGSLDLAESSSVRSKSLIISVWMKTTNVDVAIARNGVGQALIKSAHALSRSEDSRDSTRNSWVLEEQGVNVDINWDGLEG